MDDLKQKAAEKAVALVEPGMVVGLGEGSTALWALRAIARKLADGSLHDIVGVPCSNNYERIARELGIPLTTLEDCDHIDLTIDGADEVDPQLNLIKGGGGALLREKIVAQASRREIIIVDGSKLSPVLGTKWHVPIEVVPFGWGSQRRFLESLGARVTLRQNKTGSNFITDQGNFILDSHFGLIHDPAALAATLSARAGIVEHGLFVGLTSQLIVATSE
ncbi:MAG: ribose-5-phosphate isomerase RpiA [Anaerolineae bacterium]|nr:ribose-5-phosphate isomerase RpiA [Anaerolineae bacterium]